MSQWKDVVQLAEQWTANHRVSGSTLCFTRSYVSTCPWTKHRPWGSCFVSIAYTSHWIKRSHTTQWLKHCIAEDCSCLVQAKLWYKYIVSAHMLTDVCEEVSVYIQPHGIGFLGIHRHGGKTIRHTIMQQWLQRYDDNQTNLFELNMRDRIFTVWQMGNNMSTVLEQC